MKTRALRLLQQYGLTVVGLALLAGAIWVVQEKFGNLRLREIEAAIEALPIRGVVLAGMWTAVAYVILTFYDLLATRYVGHPVSYRRVAFAACCAYTFAHNLGFAAVSGAATRYRLYAQWGLTPIQIAGVVAFCSLTFGLGAMVLGGFVLFTEHEEVPGLKELPAWVSYALGVTLWLIVFGYMLMSRFYRRPIRAFGGELRLPGFRLAAAQVVLAAVDLAATALIFWALLPEMPGLTYWKFVGVYLIAYSAGLAAHLPGGIGVFDTAIAVGLSPWLDAPTIFAAIVVFRVWYYLIPMGIAGVAFAVHEIALRGRGIRRIAVSADPFVVPILSGFAAIAGALLLFEGARDGHRHLIGDWTLQLSKLAASVVGASLLVIAWGMLRRVTLAWYGVLALLAAGVGLAIFKGLPWGVPLALAAIAALILPFRASFYRATRLRAEPFSTEALLPVVGVVACSLGIALFSYRSLAIRAEAWWAAPFTAEAPLALQAGIGIAGGLLVFALYRLLRPVRVPESTYDAAARERLVSLGQERPPPRADGVVWGEAGKAGLPYLRMEEVFLGLGDPAGTPDDRVSAIWLFRDLCEQNGVDPAVWRAGPELLPVYADIGLVAFALGPDGQPLPEARDRTPEVTSYLVCRPERDLTRLLPLLPALEDGAPPNDALRHGMAGPRDRGCAARRGHVH